MIQFEPLDDNSLRATVRLSASAERVFHAWTDPTELSKWFRGSSEGSLEVQSFDCREGGDYDLTMVNQLGERNRLYGSFIAVDTNRRLVMTWQWDFAGPNTKPTLVTVEVRPDADGSILTVTHERFASVEIRNGHESGWNPALLNLVEYLGSFHSQT